MNSIDMITIMEVMADRNQEHFEELQSSGSDKRKKAVDPQTIYARIDENNSILKLLKQKANETAESKVRSFFDELQGITAIKIRGRDNSGKVPGSGGERSSENALGSETEGKENDRPSDPVTASDNGAGDSKAKRAV
jgi:hypothetical protein